MCDMVTLRRKFQEAEDRVRSNMSPTNTKPLLEMRRLALAMLVLGLRIEKRKARDAE